MKEAETAAILIAYEHNILPIGAFEVDHKGVDAGMGADWIVVVCRIRSNEDHVEERPGDLYQSVDSGESREA